jgi:large repetitive protein
MATPARPIVNVSAIGDFPWIRLIAVLLASALSFGSVSAGAAGSPQAGNSASGQGAISVAGISPSVAAAVASGEIAFPAEVKITGQNFRPGATVKIGSQAAGVVSVSATEIRATAPGEPAGTMDVTVTNPDGTSATLSKAFTYTTGPIVYEISPRTGTAAEPTVITITGGNLASDSSVTVGGQATPIQFFFSRASLRALVPMNTAVAPGGKTLGAVTVTNPDGQSFTLSNAFTWTWEPSATPATPPAPVSNNGSSEAPPRPGS